MIGKLVELGKCSGVAFSTDGSPEVIIVDGDYSGRVTGFVDENFVLMNIRNCSELMENGECRADGVMCPVPRVNL